MRLDEELNQTFTKLKPEIINKFSLEDLETVIELHNKILELKKEILRIYKKYEVVR